MGLLNFYREADDDISTSDEEQFDINQLNEQERMKLASQTRQESLQPSPVGFRNVEMNEALAQAASQLSPGAREENVQRQNVFRFRGTSADEFKDTTETSIADTIEEDRAAAGPGSQTEGGDVDAGTFGDKLGATLGGVSMSDLQNLLGPGILAGGLGKLLGLSVSQAAKLGLTTTMGLPALKFAIGQLGKGISRGHMKTSLAEHYSGQGIDPYGDIAIGRATRARQARDLGLDTVVGGPESQNIREDMGVLQTAEQKPFFSKLKDLAFRDDPGLQDQFAAGQQQDIATARGMSVEESQLLDRQLSDEQAAPSGMESPESYSEFSGYGYDDDDDYGGGGMEGGYGTSGLG